MAIYQTRPITENDLPEVGAFLKRSMEAMHGPRSSTNYDAPFDKAGARPENSFRWLLGERNPARPEDLPSGEIIRHGDGPVLGMVTYHPQVFRLGERRLLGLGAGNFFVDPSARMQGYLLFRRYLKTPQADFCFSTTCNAASGALWLKCGAAQVPLSDAEYLFVCRPGPLLQELVLRRRAWRGLASWARWLGNLAGPVVRLRWPRSGLRVERSEDWEHLADIAQRCRDPLRLTHERTPEVLRGKYEQLTRDGRTGGGVGGMYRFADAQGSEGWFSVREGLRGQLGQIRGAVLLDVVWPRQSVSFVEVLSALVQTVAPYADALNVRDRAAFGLQPGLGGWRRRPLLAAEAFVFSQPASGLPASSELAQMVDFSAMADRY
jgi:hypothetical protein